MAQHRSDEPFDSHAETALIILTIETGGATRAAYHISESGGKRELTTDRADPRPPLVNEFELADPRPRDTP